MTIQTKDDWIALAKATAPLMPEFMSRFSGNFSSVMVEDELTRLYRSRRLARPRGPFSRNLGVAA